MILLELFCDVDDFWRIFERTWQSHLLTHGRKRRGPKPRLIPSEIMTILISFHQSQYRDFKAYYLGYVMPHLRAEFPTLVSYQRFVEIIPTVLIPLIAYLWHRTGSCTGISFVDATCISVCHPKRIARNKVFRTIAKRGKSTMGYFSGLKLHLVVNEHGDIVAFHLTPGNVDDRKPVPTMATKLFGKVFGDKGYISQALFDELFQKGIELVTHVRKNMKNRLMKQEDKLLLRKRSIIETINDQLKNISQIEHSRHRSVTNFFVNVACGLIAYCHKEKKPSLKIDGNHLARLASGI